MSKIRVVDLLTYPVKGCGPMKACSMSVSLYGAAGDRIFVIVNEEGRMITQRDEPRLCLIKPSLQLDGAEIGPRSLTLATSGMPSLCLNKCDEVRGGGAGETRIHTDDVGSADCGLRAADWLTEFLGYKANLRVISRRAKLRESKKPYPAERHQLAFQDALPLLVCSVESLDAFNTVLAKMEPLERAKTALNFRPNIVVEGAGAFDELFWRRFHHQAPDADPDEALHYVNYEGLKRCDRCQVPDVDPETGILLNKGLTIKVLRELGMEMPLYPEDEIGTARAPVFGMNVAWRPSQGNRIALGSVITVSERWPAGR